MDQIVSKKINSIEEAKAFANEVRAKYPNIVYVEDLIDQARIDGVLTNKTETMIVWGRLLRVMPTKSAKVGA